MRRALLMLLASCAHVAPAPTPAPAPVIDGTPNGLLWDGGALFIADDAHDTIVKWTGGRGEVVATIAGGGEPGLGQIARLPDGRLVVTRFGHGQDGGIFLVAGGVATPIAGLDPARRRLGIAVAPDGAVYEAWFAGEHGPNQKGGIARVGLDGTETEVMTDMVKPVGVAVANGVLLAGDQSAGELRRCTLPACADATVVAKVDGIDLFDALAGGDVIAGTKTGTLVRITPAGQVTTLATEPERIRGVAVGGERIFYVTGRGARTTIRVLDQKR